MKDSVYVPIDDPEYPSERKNQEGILDGPYATWYKNGKSESAGTYSDDSYNRDWIWYKEDGTLFTKEKYSNGKLIDLSCFDTKGEYAGAACSDLKLPVFIHSLFCSCRIHRIQIIQT